MIEKAYDVSEIRRTVPNAYRRWTEDEDKRLWARCLERATVEELAAEFGRKKGAITSRINKLGAERYFQTIFVPLETL